MATDFGVKPKGSPVALEEAQVKRALSASAAETIDSGFI